MEDIGLSKKLLEDFSEFTLDECVELAEIVKPKDWKKKLGSGLGLTYEGKLDGVIKIELTHEVMLDNPKGHHGLNIFIKDNLVRTCFDVKYGQIQELYQKIDNRNYNKHIKEIREYLESI